jgi:hypothetical protein
MTKAEIAKKVREILQLVRDSDRDGMAYALEDIAAICRYILDEIE